MAINIELPIRNISYNGQNVKLTNVSLTEGQTLTIRARSRSTSYVMGVGNLSIVEN